MVTFSFDSHAVVTGHALYFVFFFTFIKEMYMYKMEREILARTQGTTTLYMYI